MLSVNNCYFKEGDLIFAICVKYLFTLISCFYTFTRLLHIVPSKKVYLSFGLSLIPILPLFYLMRTHTKPLSFLIMVLLFTCFVVIFLKVTPKLALIVSIFSFGISTIYFVLSAFVAYPICSIINLFTHEFPPDIIAMFILGITQISIAYIPFQFKRLKKGMPFLYDYASNDLGFYISINLLFAISFFGFKEQAYLVFTIPVFFTMLCGLSILYWWKSRLSQKYIEKINAKETEALQEIINNKERQIDELKFHNDELAKIIHSDNKLIPSMELALREYLLSAEYETDHQSHIDKAKELITQLQDMTKERVGIINTYEVTGKQLTKTNVLPIDNLLSYMLQKASRQHINFDFSLTGSIKYLTDTIIGVEDLRTLLADLIENAIIATKKEHSRKVMINIGIIDGQYFIDILDSGTPFKVEVLLNIGVKQITTHAEDGGSGIGLMTTYELISKYDASLVIEEYLNNNIFTKKVSVVFDKQNQLRIKSNRDDLKNILSFRSDIIFINSDKSNYIESAS